MILIALKGYSSVGSGSPLRCSLDKTINIIDNSKLELSIKHTILVYSFESDSKN